MGRVLVQTKNPQHPAIERAHPMRFHAVDAYAGEAEIGRVAELAPRQRLRFEAHVVVGARALDGRVLRVVGLHQHPARPLAAPGTAGDCAKSWPRSAARKSGRPSP